MSHANPPPSVKPAIPVCETDPRGTASPRDWVARSSLPISTPGWARTTRSSASSSMPFINAKSMTIPSSQTRVPGSCARRRARRSADRPRGQISGPRRRRPHRHSARSPQGVGRWIRSRRGEAGRMSDLLHGRPGRGDAARGASGPDPAVLTCRTRLRSVSSRPHGRSDPDGRPELLPRRRRCESWASRSTPERRP